MLSTLGLEIHCRQQGFDTKEVLGFNKGSTEASLQGELTDTRMEKRNCRIFFRTLRFCFCGTWYGAWTCRLCRKFTIWIYYLNTGANGGWMPGWRSYFWGFPVNVCVCFGNRNLNWLRLRAIHLTVLFKFSIWYDAV